MLSLRRSVFRNLKPGAIYVAPAVLQQQRARAFQAVATLSEPAATFTTRAASPPLSRFLPVQQQQSRMMSTDAQPTESSEGLPHHKGLDGAPLPATKRIYVGNISYGIRAEDLEREFGEFGKVEHAKIIYDPRGLSKGFGYIEFEQLESAKAAVQKMHGLIVDGRRINVQYVLRPERTDGFEGNPPSRTLFIGNLSFDITDKDLNDLFTDVRNCTDVRVAIDRRTGQPRGFAHADFIDISSAEKAKTQLEGKSIYGRTIRIDFTKNNPQRTGTSTEAPAAGGRSFLAGSASSEAN